MSYLAEREIACPACKQPIAAEVWASINVREDPELKDLLLGGEINIVECPACKEAVHVDTFVLYHDPDDEIIAFVFPEDETLTGDLLNEKMNADFDTTQATLPEQDRLSYRPLAFKGLNELVAFVEREDEIALQGEVLLAISSERRLPVRKLRPSVARERNLPRVVPILEEKGKSERDALISGLRRLRELNDRLTVYNDALERLTRQPDVPVRLS
jgi:hypothetical protein